MYFDYRQFRIDATPLAYHGHYFARARIYQRDSAGQARDEVRWSGDTRAYPDELTAVEVARQWAIAWIDDYRA
ncbi:hypothetical protein AWB74_07422 [Caballeronia arvi]|uniref:Uncharacterized protein n=1 Tax=Caballeronia arvi TaxID=1777135 RepID=A0A158KYD3_9BURK|nr:hypothetical protein [Caballeronia arvi]SAL85749.1 hypothetical protein AWB74_07422 [Caballeronia arvi]